MALPEPPDMPDEDMGQAPQRACLADGLVRQLASDIIEGRLVPGIRLDECELADRFSVSRTPVREALTQLCTMGLAERRPHRGVIVTILSPSRFEEMFVAMAELEAMMAGLAALAMTSNERYQFEALHLRSAAAVSSGATEEYEAMNIQFHTRIYAGAHNGYLQEIASMTRQRMAPFRRAQFNVLGRLSGSFSEHETVVRAILRADAQAAQTHMRAHMLASGTTSARYVEIRSRHDRTTARAG